MTRMAHLVLAILLAAAAPALALAQEFTAGNLTIDQAWVRMIITSRPGAAYVRIDNAGHASDRLVGARTPRAERAEFHTHIMENNVAAMRRVDAIDIPAHGMAMLAPGGGHIMLFGLDADLAEGMTIPLTLEFEHAGSIEIEVTIMREPPEGAAMEGDAEHGTGSMDGMDHGDGASESGHGSD